MCKTSNVDDFVRSFCWLNRSSPLIRNSGRDFSKLAAGVYIYIYINWLFCEDSAPLHSHYVYSWNCSVSLVIDGTAILDKGVQWSNFQTKRQLKTMAVFSCFFFQFMDFWQPTIFRNISWYVSREFHSELFCRIFLLGKKQLFFPPKFGWPFSSSLHGHGDSRWVSMRKSSTSDTTTQCGHWVFWSLTCDVGEKSFNKQNNWKLTFIERLRNLKRTKIESIEIQKLVYIYI